MSKQFQRTIFKRKCDRIDFAPMTSDSKRMELLFKKFPNIRFYGYYYLYEFFDQLYKQNRFDLIDKFRPKVYSLRITTKSLNELFYSIGYFPNVERVQVYLNRPKNGFVSEFKFEKLRQIGSLSLQNKSWVICRHFWTDIRLPSLLLFVYFHDKRVFDTEVDTLLVHISNLSQLSFLRLKIKSEIYFVDNKIKEMLCRLPRLKSVQLNDQFKYFGKHRVHYRGHPLLIFYYLNSFYKQFVIFFSIK